MPYRTTPFNMDGITDVDKLLDFMENVKYTDSMTTGWDFSYGSTATEGRCFRYYNSKLNYEINLSSKYRKFKIFGIKTSIILNIWPKCSNYVVVVNTKEQRQRIVNLKKKLVVERKKFIKDERKEKKLNRENEKIQEKKMREDYLKESSNKLKDVLSRV